MPMNNNFLLSQTTRKYFNYLLYLIFIIYMIYSIYMERQTSVRLLYAAILLLAGSGVALAEVLKAWSTKALLALIQDCDPEAGMAYLAKIQKFDLFKGYRNFSLSFQSLAMQDLGQPQALLDWLDKVGEKPFSTSLDLRLVYLHSRFRANLVLNNKEQTREYFQATMNLKDKKVLNKMISPLYSWDQIVAEYQYFSGSTKEARKSLAKVDTNKLNPREKVYYLLLDGKICLKDQATTTARERLDAVVAGAGKTTMATEAKALLAGI
jgi:hypothetical protein